MKGAGNQHLQLKNMHKYSTDVGKILRNEKACKFLAYRLSAQNWIRTSTPLRALRPEHSASTNFAIWATVLRDCKGIQLFYSCKFFFTEI